MAKLLGVRAFTTLGIDQTTGTEFITGRQMHGLFGEQLGQGFPGVRDGATDSPRGTAISQSPHDTPRDFSVHPAYNPIPAALDGLESAILTTPAARGLNPDARQVFTDPRLLHLGVPGCGVPDEDAKTFNGYELHGAVSPNGGSPMEADEGTLTVTVGGSVSGNIDFAGDVDTITVTLVAGQTYSFSLTGTGATPVSDTFLSLFSPSAALLVEDDDGGNGTFSLITVTAATSGTYTLTAESFSNPGDPGLGEWTLSVHQQGADEAPGAPPSAVVAHLGDNYGFISPAGTDVDVYQVTLTAGMIYNFAVAGGSDYNTDWQAVPLGELDTIISVYNSAGTLLYTNDDIDFPDDISSALGFVAETSGTYYVEVDAYSGQTGGYVLNISETDLGDLDPLDAIDWGGPTNVVSNADPLLIYFATAGQTYDGVTDIGGWTPYLQQQALEAFQTYSQFANLSFAITTNSAIADFHLVTTTSTEFLAYFNPPGETNAGVGVFATNGSGWDPTGAEGSMEPGGYGWITFIHEFGHGLGMAHPHDDGGGSDVMPGVTGPFGSYGIFDLNQGVYTTMSYNDGWQLHPDVDANGFPVPDTLDYGYQGTPMALDIALMQIKYGAVAHNTGNNVYTLGAANLAGTFYQCIWDTGGTDEINYVGTSDATIDLTAATLDYSATGAGVISWVDGIFGGYTIANGVVIENATGGNGNDTLVGNAAANVLTGNNGNDTFFGGLGNDTIHGGLGTDTAVFAGNQADYTVTPLGGGVYTVTDNNLANGNEGTDTIDDVRFLQFADHTVNLEDSPGNQAPTLTGLNPTLVFNENTVNAGPQLIDGDVTFDDSDGNFNGGTVTVAGALAEDIIGIRNEGTGIGQIGVSGANVTYGGVVIGTFAGGAGGATLTVTLNAAATSIAVDQLLENLTYANNSGDPTLNRTLTINVIDSDGAGLGTPVFTPGPYVERTGAQNPLGGIVIGDGPSVAMIDADGDGDRDIVLGDQPGVLRYFQNNAGVFTELTGGSNPFGAFNSGGGSYTSPEAINIDGDGDLDLIYGENDGTIHTLRNNGNGTFTELTGAGVNPFNGIDVGNFSDVAGIDYDNDGDMDVVIGAGGGTGSITANNGALLVWQNNAGVFTQQTGAANPFNGVDVGSFSSPTGGDVDGDGDIDLVVGNSAGQVRTWLNNGSGVFTEATGVSNPFNGVTQGYGIPSLVDVDGDGFRDLVLGGYNQTNLRYFENTSTSSPGTAPTVQITVNAQNDAPSGTNNSIVVSEDDSHIFTVAEFGFSDTDGDALSAVVISTLPAQGTLLLNGVAVTAGQAIPVASITGGLLTYAPDPGEFGASYASFTFAVRDNGGTANSGVDTDPTPNTMAIAVTPDNTAPTLTGLDASVTFLENVVNATPQILDSDVTFTDAEGNFNGGALEVTGMLAEDFIGINNQGTGAGQIGVSGLNVTYGGVVIGTITDAVGLFTVDLNAAATSAAVDALIQNLTYFNNSDTPTPSRELHINVTDAGGLDLTQPAGFAEVTGAADPLGGLPVFGDGPNLAFVDVNHDGDLDIVVGDADGSLRYFENNGAGYTEVTGAANPFDGFVGETQGGATGSLYTAPCTIDIDGDGDLDLVVANNYGYFGTVQNNGNGTWTQLTGAANPLDGIVDIYFADAAGIDYDGDGDMDLVSGSSYGDMYAIRNDGGGNFTFMSGVGRPFGGAAFDVGNFSSVASGDVDGDGDLDLVVGESDGTLNTFINNGGGSFTAAVGAANPFNGIDVGSYSIPTLVDIDGDGDADLVVGDNSGGDTRVFLNNAGGTPSIVVNVTPENDIFPVELYDGSNVLVGTFSTIQGAVNAASDGYRIFVGAGTYNEDVTVDVDVTIQGANVGVAGTDGGRVAESIIDGSITVTAAGVTVDGVEITGDSASGGFSAGVIVQANGFSLVNSILSGRDGDFVDDTVGVLAGAVTGLDVGDNLITGYLRGVYLFSAVTQGSVHDNTFQGAGSPNPGFEGMGNGINTETQLVIVQNNTFDGIWAGVVNVGPTGTNPADLATFILNNIYTDVGERPVQVYPTNDVHEIFGTDENEAFNGDLAVTDNGITNASFTFHGRGGNDHIYGHTMGDFLYGDAGEDRIFASGGNDQMTGGSGNDLLDGGAGTDTAFFADTGLSYSDTVIGWIINSSEGNDFLQNTEIVVDGAAHRNLLVGSTGYATLQTALTAAQNDDNVRLASGNYSGTLNYSASGLTVIAQAGAVQNVTYSTASAFGITVNAGNGADTITGSANGDTLNGGGGIDTLNGGAGNDTLNGGTGNDTMRGGIGDDAYFLESSGDIVIEATGEGFDQAFTSASYALAAGVSIEVLSAVAWGATTALSLSGNELHNIVYGNAGDNTLNGGGGADILIGFGGNDNYYVDNAGDVVLEAAGAGNDAIFSSVSYTLGAGVEAEVLSTVSFGGTTAINLTGNELHNIVYGNAGDNVLNGGGGADVLIGFAGNDSYFVDNAGDVVAEGAGAGGDTVFASVSYALSAGSEVEVLSVVSFGDTAAINLTGNEYNNIIYGNAGANVLDGKGGNDLLIGQAGADTYSFTTALGAGNVDTAVGFEHGVDKIALDDAVFTQIGGLGTLNANAFVTGSAAGDADDRIIYNSATGQLFYDADGNGAGAAVLFANVASGLSLSASDFMVI